MVTAVLLVLRGVHAGIIRYANDHTRVHTGIGHSIEGISRDIEAYVFLRAERTAAGQTGAKGRFHGYLFIGSPFAIDVIELHCFFSDFCTGGTGIAGNEADAGFVQTAGYSLVAQQELFVCVSHTNFLLVTIHVV